MSRSLLTKMKTVIFMPEALRSVQNKSEFYYNILSILFEITCITIYFVYFTVLNILT